VRSLSLVVVVVASGLLPSVVARAQVPAELQAAESLAVRVETAERSPDLAAGIDEWLDLPTVDAQLAAVSDFLSHNPDDLIALVLSVRLGRLHDLLAFREATMASFSDPQAGMPERPMTERYQEMLDGVLLRDSTLAAAHYWKARLMVEETALLAELAAEGVEPTSDTVPNAPGTAATLQHAEAAVANDSDNEVYREFYAMLLVLDGKAEAAEAVLDHPATSGTLLHWLIRDLIVFAPPPGAEPDDVLYAYHYLNGMMGAANTEDEWMAEYLDFRLRAWSTLASLSEVQESYRSLWPEARFFTVDGWDGVMSAAFVATPEGWRAISDSGELESDSSDQADIVSLLLLPPDAVADMEEGAARRGMPGLPRNSGPRVGILYTNARHRRE